VRNVRATVVVPVLAAGAMLLAGCGGGSNGATDSAGISVVASTNVYASITQAIGGDFVSATSFIESPDQDPHSYEASGRDILAVSKADLVIENGGGYDDFMDTLLDSATGDARVLNVVDQSGLPSDVSGFNEHVWYNLPVIQKTADAIANELSTIEPSHADDFKANASAFDRDLQALIDREAELRPQLRGKPVAVTEPVPGYMLDALGLKNVTPVAFTEAVEEGNDVAVSVLAQTLDLAKKHRIDALVYNEQTTGAVTDQFQDAAKGAGIPVVGVTETLPAGDDYITWMRDNLDRIAGAVMSD
jgi:zinc/manganese transport system substrate-binding protein